MITPITSAMIIANRKLSPLRVSANFIPNSFFSRGKVTIPTIVRVVRNATDGTIPTPAFTSVPTRGKAINAGTRVIVPKAAATTVAKRTFCFSTNPAIC